ncbi:MAG: hypothetical protein ACUVQZ_05540 [Candidatus Caldatribacteriaceae bacterium]
MKRTLTMMSERLSLAQTLVLTGGGIKALLDYKRRVFKNFVIEVKEDCFTWGCVEMARKVLRF